MSGMVEISHTFSNIKFELTTFVFFYIAMNGTCDILYNDRLSLLLSNTKTYNDLFFSKGFFLWFKKKTIFHYLFYYACFD